MEADRKYRIYFDTSIPNYLFADDAPERMEWTWRLWERCVAGDYEICVSEVFFAELENCPEEKLRKIDEQLARIEINQLDESEEAEELAYEFIKCRAFTEKSINDSLHVAYAVVYDCDVVLSWNFHQTREWTRDIVKEVTSRCRYKSVRILQPDVFLKGGY